MVRKMLLSLALRRRKELAIASLGKIALPSPVPRGSDQNRTVSEIAGRQLSEHFDSGRIDGKLQEGKIAMNFDNTPATSGPTHWQPSPSAELETPKGNGTVSNRSKDKKLDEAGEKLAAEMAVYNQVAEELKSKRNLNLPAHLRRKQVVEIASELFGVAPTWTAFYRETLGTDGVVRALFADPEEMREYDCSEEHSRVLEMLTVLRSRDLPENDPHEPQRMITVRIPKSLHDAICDEANQLAVSVNKLCISRLLQRVDRAMIPSSSQKRRGRRPGAAGNTKPDVASDPTTATAPRSTESEAAYANLDQ